MYVDNPFESPSILSLCTGMRGLERGLEEAIGKLNTVAYVEIEAFVDENLVTQMEEGLLAPAPIWTNVKTFPSSLFRNRIHGITGGYPCQPFSFAGKRNGQEDPRHLWPYIKTMVGAIEPVWCFFENVPGHLTLGYREVRSDLESLGYKVEEGIFSASEVGAPHQRKRLYILAIKSDWLEDAKHIGFPWSRRRTVDKEWTPEPSAPASEGGLGNSYGKWKPQQEGELKEFREWTVNDGEGIVAYSYCKQRRIEQQFSRGDATGTWYEPSRSREEGDVADSQRQGLQVSGEQSARAQQQALERGGGFSIPVAYPNVWRSQQWYDAGMGRIKEPFTWPARRGEPQYAYEPPRTIESRVGYVINGYNFREDLLRLAGNGVVEQTAELAFITLLNKHFNHEITNRKNP